MQHDFRLIILSADCFLVLLRPEKNMYSNCERSSHMKVYVLATRMKPNSLGLPSNRIQMEWWNTQTSTPTRTCEHRFSRTLNSIFLFNVGQAQDQHAGDQSPPVAAESACISTRSPSVIPCVGNPCDQHRSDGYSTHTTRTLVILPSTPVSADLNVLFATHRSPSRLASLFPECR